MGLPNDTDAGFWTNFMRKGFAPLENGSLSAASMADRKNRALFFQLDTGTVMPEKLWRDDTQPGNTVDIRDERCTAQSRPGQQPEYLGIDDYACDEHQLHYTVCQTVLNPWP